MPQQQAYYLVDNPRSGIDNMAWDQAMLEQTDRDGVVRIRFYQWARPTVSLGYFQRLAEFDQFCQSVSSMEVSSIDLVRRATGGGAIVHHFDWTYSISIPTQLEEAGKSVGASCGLYFNIHRAIAHWLNQNWRGHQDAFSPQSVSLWGDKPDSTNSDGGCGVQNVDASRYKNFDFLCFNRRSPGDIVIGDHKVMGSAQRRWKSAILQHGSLLLARSPWAPQLLGLREILALRWNLDRPEHEVHLDFASSLVNRLAECYHLTCASWDCSRPFTEFTDKIKNRLESPTWIARI